MRRDISDHLRENGRPAGTPGRIALPVAGDDDSAKAVIMQLVDELGFDAVDTGSLDESWRQQPGAPVYTTDLDADGVRRVLSEASPKRPPQWRATPNSPGSFTDPTVVRGLSCYWASTELSGIIRYGPLDDR